MNVACSLASSPDFVGCDLASSLRRMRTIVHELRGSELSEEIQGAAAIQQRIKIAEQQAPSATRGKF